MSQNLREALRSIARSNQVNNVFFDIVYNTSQDGKLVSYN